MGILIGLLLAFIAVLVSIPFLPVIQEAITGASLNTSVMVGTPIVPIVGLFVLFSIFVIAIVIIASSARGV